MQLQQYKHFEIMPMRIISWATRYEAGTNQLNMISYQIYHGQELNLPPIYFQHHNGNQLLNNHYVDLR